MAGTPVSTLDDPLVTLMLTVAYVLGYSPRSVDRARIEYEVYGDLIIIYPKPYSIYFSGDYRHCLADAYLLGIKGSARQREASVAQLASGL